MKFRGKRGKKYDDGMMFLYALAGFWLLVLYVSGCAKGPPKVPVPGVPFSGGIEHVTRDILAGHQGFIEKAKENHPKCAVDVELAEMGRIVALYPEMKDDPICKAIWSAISGHNIAWDVLGAYCSSPEWAANDPEAECSPPMKGSPLEAQLRSRLLTVVANLDGIIANLRRLNP